VPPIASGKLQSIFDKFRRFLRVSGVEVSTPVFYWDQASAEEGRLGEFIVPPGQAIRPPLAMIVTAWLDEREGRDKT
jgi:hypothetical protein